MLLCEQVSEQSSSTTEVKEHKHKQAPDISFQGNKDGKNIVQHFVQRVNQAVKKKYRIMRKFTTDYGRFRKVRSTMVKNVTVVLRDIFLLGCCSVVR